MTDHELAEIKAGVERCEAKHVGQVFPFCENYGCMSMRPLLDEIDQLRRELAVAERVKRSITSLLEKGQTRGL